MTDRAGNPVVRTETEIAGSYEGGAGEGAAGLDPLAAALSTVESRTTMAASTVTLLKSELRVREDVDPILVPRLRMSTIKSRFSLGDLTDMRPFRELGERIAADPAQELRRTVFSARRVMGSDGLPQVQVVPPRRCGYHQGFSELFPLTSCDLTSRASYSPPKWYRVALRRNITSTRFCKHSLRDSAHEGSGALSHYLDRAAARLIRLIEEKQREAAPPPSYKHDLDMVQLDSVRYGRPETSQGSSAVRFKEVSAIPAGRIRSTRRVWFDSEPERAVANILDEEDSISPLGSGSTGTISQFSGTTLGMTTSRPHSHRERWNTLAHRGESRSRYRIH